MRPPADPSARRRGWRWPLAAALSVVLLASPTVTQAQLDDADRAFADGRLAEAGRAYEDALATGRLDRDAVARAHLRLGALSALGSEDTRAERHFRVALALDPGAEAPRGIEGEARERFEALRGERLRLIVSTDAGAPLSVEVRGAPDGLARTVEVLGGGDFVRRFGWEGRAIEVEVPSGARPVFVRVLDAHGNALAVHGEPVAEDAVGGAVDGVVDGVEGSNGGEVPPPGPLPRAGGGEGAGDETWIESPWFWVAVGLVVAGVAVAVGFAASGERFVLDAPVIR